ncbi:ADP-ribosylglycohydrolase [Thermocatellispora tengchongensis]|uniref:ADP-ribosylglycohydrolase n=1 Tax=Thermocatellispora tengchongensis TaxID=1073253 RepID=A0A840P8L6_9ACTN|nr:ADP-ribosylglycohydrolase family protein [Thermocatellispora tengchongensis]MBB5133780.1 ADP-ribosylglycohydrolase [Thermocatellispora tengchongensis]
MLEIDLRGDLYADKVHGCWLGKNAGGTLGAPVEQLYGRPEPLDVRWYPELREGGIPNDDLELQLIWLLALEEVGPALTARDLARYWLDHVGYNFDEYGMAKANLRLGLEPPLTGSHNNWFADCMGCPIRAEIWACVAPGAPRTAARYAFQDAILDHAGGESVYGELFNAALESAAFVVGDRRKLVDIGLSYVPESSRTAAAIRAAVAGFEAGLDRLETRRRVIAAAPHHVAQYSPINLGFQVIGLLYGDDFGDALCTTVNCGYDTDSSGAAVGAFLGILAGRSGLPEKWTAPLGEQIATNESWGGVRGLAGLVPDTLTELTERIRAVALRLNGQVVRTPEADLYADSSIADLWNRSPTTVVHSGPDVHVSVAHGDGPVVIPGQVKELTTVVRNTRRVPITVRAALAVPDGWKAPGRQEVELPAGASATLTWQVEAPDRTVLDVSNRLFLSLSPAGRPEPPAVPIVLLGASAYRVSGQDRSWREVYATGNAVPVDPGVRYLQTFAHAPRAVDAWLAVEATCAVRLWANGALVAEAPGPREIRPCHRGTPGSSGPVGLREGWNEIRIELVRGEGAPPAECHVLFATDDRFRAALTELGRTRFPWDLTRR